MTVRISSTGNRSTRVEPLGPALVWFSRGIADLADDVRPGVLAAARRKGYRVSDDYPETPAPKVRRRKPASKPAPASGPPLEPEAPITGRTEVPGATEPDPAWAETHAELEALGLTAEQLNAKAAGTVEPPPAALAADQ